ncbi:MAG: pyridoxamine 5'-phosphate oxidase family protein [Myxococcota bacterium]
MTDAASPLWHPGEEALQRRVGSHAHLAALAPRILRPFMPEQHRTFFTQLPFVVLGTVDDEGRPWSTLRAGPPGFVGTPDDRHIHVASAPEPEDPARFEAGAPVGVLGIEPHTRRRNRANGAVLSADADGFEIAVAQSFGNCPKYITRREARFVQREASATERFEGLDAEGYATVSEADTFFVASYVRGEGGRAQVDVSHRGGPAGFVQREGDALVAPDYVGNQFFNTLGNFELNPVAGLTFVDFGRGDLLQLTGTVALNFDAPSDLPGALRAWRFTPTHGVRRRGALALRWSDVLNP